ncbi:hypothetical protein D3Z39_12905 [Anaerotruncus colihominis]|uniref:Uncharacterized protein n=1 Tax=Anaerotruncus colihominis TaxID=169435 RepID=A0A845RJL8_9FIRM|nr:hypothetical protein [Anaerotruncus colihominis]
MPSSPFCRQAYLTDQTFAGVRDCFKNQNTRLFLQTAADTALKCFRIQKDSCVFSLAFSCCLRTIRQFLYFQTSPNLAICFYIISLLDKKDNRSKKDYIRFGHLYKYEVSPEKLLKLEKKGLYKYSSFRYNGIV